MVKEGELVRGMFIKGVLLHNPPLMSLLSKVMSTINNMEGNYWEFRIKEVIWKS